MEDNINFNLRQPPCFGQSKKTSIFWQMEDNINFYNWKMTSITKSELGTAQPQLVKGLKSDKTSLDKVFFQLKTSLRLWTNHRQDQKLKLFQSERNLYLSEQTLDIKKIIQIKHRSKITWINKFVDKNYSKDLKLQIEHTLDYFLDILD